MKKTDGGPATYNDWRCEFDDCLMHHEPDAIYDAGLAEGLRWNRNNQLRDMAKAAMQGLMATGEYSKEVPLIVAFKATEFAEALLAELERRNEAREAKDVKG